MHPDQLEDPWLFKPQVGQEILTASAPQGWCCWCWCCWWWSWGDTSSGTGTQVKAFSLISAVCLAGMEKGADREVEAVERLHALLKNVQLT